MKMSEVDYLLEPLQALQQSHPLIRDNFKFMKNDFERVFKETLEMEQPEGVPEEALQGMKTDMLMTFVWGMAEGCDPESSFRKNFNLPKEVVNNMAKSKIITPDNNISNVSRPSIIV